MKERDKKRNQRLFLKNYLIKNKLIRFGVGFIKQLVLCIQLLEKIFNNRNIKEYNAFFSFVVYKKIWKY